ncbi:MAG: hypothetical protein ACYS9X_32065 [Planctomycetota bacterium]
MGRYLATLRRVVPALTAVLVIPGGRLRATDAVTGTVTDMVSGIDVTATEEGGPASLEPGILRTVPVEIEFEEAERLFETTYTIPAGELADIVARIREALKSPPTLDGTEVRYSDGCAWFDFWVKMCDTAEPGPRPDCRYRGYYRAGRVVCVERLDAEGPRVISRVWYNEDGAPVLCADYRHHGDGTGWTGYAWGDYDARGLLRRVVRLSGSLRPAPPAPDQRPGDFDSSFLCVHIFDNADGYESTTEYFFGPKGRLCHRRRNVGDDMFYVSRSEPTERKTNSGSRLWWLRRMERYGLASIYPIPEQADPPEEGAEVPFEQEY